MAASGEAQVLRVPCTVLLGTRAAVMQRSKLRLKLAARSECLGEW